MWTSTRWGQRKAEGAEAGPNGQELCRPSGKGGGAGEGPPSCAQTSVGLGATALHPWKARLASSWDPNQSSWKCNKIVNASSLSPLLPPLLPSSPSSPRSASPVMSDVEKHSAWESPGVGVGLAGVAARPGRSLVGRRRAAPLGRLRGPGELPLRSRCRGCPAASASSCSPFQKGLTAPPTPPGRPAARSLEEAP